MVVLAILAAGILGFILTKRYHILFEDFILLYAYAGCFGMIGAKVLYLIVNADKIDWSRILDPEYFQILMSGGFVFYGGLIGGIIAMPAVKKIHKIDTHGIIKVVMPCIPLAHALGRIGCHLTGCCYGVEYDGPFHIVYRNNYFAPNGVGLFPVQLTEAVFNFILAMALLIYLLKKGPSVVSVYIYIIAYSVGRFILEFFRGDDSERGIFFFLSTSQIISIIIIIVTLVYIYFKKQLKDKIITKSVAR